jgi:hypothetical protein
MHHQTARHLPTKTSVTAHRYFTDSAIRAASHHVIIGPLSSGLHNVKVSIFFPYAPTANIQASLVLLPRLLVLISIQNIRHHHVTFTAD